MSLIQSWLLGKQNFVYGRILYGQFGQNEHLKQLLAKGETQESKAALIAALQALVLVKPAAIQPKPVEAGEVTAMQESDDAVEKSLQADWKAHYTNMNLLRGKLDVYGTDNSPKTISICHDICREILSEEKYINSVWEKLDYYRVHKQLPEVAEETIDIPSDPLQLGKFIESTKRNIRRNKQKAIKEPNNALYPALILKYETLLQQIHEHKTETD